MVDVVQLEVKYKMINKKIYNVGIVISYDRPSFTLKIVETALQADGSAINKQLLQFSFSKFNESDHHITEKTIGEIVLYALEMATPSGLRKGVCEKGSKCEKGSATVLKKPLSTPVLKQVSSLLVHQLSKVCRA